MYVCGYEHMSAGTHRCQKRASSFGAGVSGSYELQCGYWEPNLGLLKSSKYSELVSHLSSPHVIFLSRGLAKEEFLSS